MFKIRVLRKKKFELNSNFFLLKRKPMSDTRVLTEADTACLCSAVGKSSRYSSCDLGRCLVADNTDA